MTSSLIPYKIYRTITSNAPDPLTISFRQIKKSFALTSIVYDGSGLEEDALEWLNSTLSEYPSVAFTIEPEVTQARMIELAQKLHCPATIRLFTPDTFQIPEEWKRKVSHLVMDHQKMVVCARFNSLIRLSVLSTDDLCCIKCPRLKVLEAFHANRVKVVSCEALTEIKLNQTRILEWNEGKEFVKFKIPIGCIWNGKKIVEIIEQDNGSHCLVHEN